MYFAQNCFKMILSGLFSCVGLCRRLLSALPVNKLLLETIKHQMESCSMKRIDAFPSNHKAGFLSPVVWHDNHSFEENEDTHYSQVNIKSILLFTQMNHNFFYLYANISTSAKQKTLWYVGGLYKICMKTDGWKPHDEYVGVVRRACSWYSWSCTNKHLHILLEF